MIETKGLSVVLDEQVILSDINLRLDSGTFTAIVGRNGSGKSTLLKCLIGRIPLQKGQALLEGQPIQKWRGIERAAKLAWLPQRQAISDPVPVWLLVSAARYRFEETHAKRKDKALETLERIGMLTYANRLWHSLSGGEAQRVALATLLAQECPFWLLDEPANHLDPAVQHQVYSQLIQAWTSGIGMTVVTHDLNLLMRNVDAKQASQIRVLGLNDGTCAFQMLLTDDRLPDALSELYGIKVDLIIHNETPLLVFGSDP